MSVNCFVLSTPDLKFNPLIDWLARELSWPSYPEQVTGGLPGESITDLYQRLLQSQQKGWYEHINQTSLLADNSSYQEDIDRITEQFVTHNCLIHDPLLCRFFPMWRNAAKSPKVLLHYSEPLECALSLQRNWRMPIAVGLALWESYIIDACKSLAEQEHILMSSQQVIRSSDSSLASLIAWLTGDHGLYESMGTFTWPKWKELEPVTSVSKVYLKSCLQDSQIEILELLEKEKVSAIAERELSFLSADTLEYYGQLRGALEHANATCESYKNKYLELNSTTLQSQQGNDHKEETIQPQQSHSSEQLCNVKVQIEGMESLEFSSPVNSPVLDMLRTHLSQGAEDQMIYLNYGETGNETLYFMSSSLLTLETELI